MASSNLKQFLNQRKQKVGVADMNVRLYDGPIGLPVMTGADLVPANEEKKDISLKRCGDLVMEIEGKEAYVYDTNVNLSRRWDREYLPALSRTPVAYFDFSGEGE
ncbi:MAG: hypothetical protein IJ733_14645, partial [Lachnospiraceae bacterium]|nr:hypothetical protein [Lachnospiraceae bacterium]